MSHATRVNIGSNRTFQKMKWQTRAGLAGNQAAMAVSKAFGGYGEGGHGYVAVVTLLVIVYSLNFVNVLLLKKTAAST